MCGIFGVAYPINSKHLSMDALNAMDGSLYHRGPDQHGLYQDDNVVLGCRRLSIIDLEGGNQPIQNEDGSVRAILNGEIYNFREFRDLLQQKGHRFRTDCDTEVLAHGYEEFGVDFVSRLNGMFALAIWDAKKRQLLLARDRIGIKPLFYSLLDDGRLIFGSELKALLASKEVPVELDPVALNEYLSFEYIPTPRSIIKSVRKLQPGHFAIYQDGSFRETRYWDIDFGDEEEGTKSERDWVEELRTCLRESVQMEMVSDVPIGVFLSGGIDSSAITAMMGDSPSGPVRSFTMGCDDQSFDESQLARSTAEHLGTTHKEDRIDTGALLSLVPQLGGLLDEPLADSSLLPTYLLSKFARKHVKVALSGDGGDELFAGYSTLQAHRLAASYGRLPSFLRRSLIPRAVNRLPVSMGNISLDFRLKRFVNSSDFPSEVRHHRWLGSFTDEEKSGLLAPGVTSQLDGHNTYDVVYQHLESCRAQLPLNRLLYLDMKLYLEGDILQKVDRASMACSLEVRVPLLNHRLVETALRMPLGLKLNGFKRKYIFRKAMEGILPAPILKRGKKGFNIPMAKWLRGELRDLTTDMLSPERLKRQGLFNPAFVETLVRQHMGMQNDHRKLLWTLISFQFWWEANIPNKTRPVRS